MDDVYTSIFQDGVTEAISKMSEEQLRSLAIGSYLDIRESLTVAVAA